MKDWIEKSENLLKVEQRLKVTLNLKWLVN
jgi:hypothetical protein